MAFSNDNALKNSLLRLNWLPAQRRLSSPDHGLFSSLYPLFHVRGYLADRFSKRTITIGVKPRNRDLLLATLGFLLKTCQWGWPPSS
jgi:hypothetical protein